MKKTATVLGLALGGLCLLGCDNQDKTVAELTGKLLDMQTRLGALEALQNRVNILESMGQRVSNLEAAEKRVANLEGLNPRVTTLETHASRISALESLESRIAALETLPPRVRTVEGLTARVASLETLPPRMSDLDKLSARVAVLEELVRNQQRNAGKNSQAKEPTALQRVLSVLEEYKILEKTGETAPVVFLGHVARVDHGDANMTDFPLLAEMLELGEADNPVPLSCVKAFVDAGADVETPISGGQTPLMSAASQADPSIVRYFLEKGVDATRKTADGNTALYFATNSGHGAKRAEIVRLLCAAGCDVNARFANGSTPLLEAVDCGADAELIEQLLNLGADIAAVDASGATVMDIMESRKDILGVRVTELIMDAWEKSQAQAEPEGQGEGESQDAPAE